MSASQPSRFAPSASQSPPRREFIFEALLDSDEAVQELLRHTNSRITLDLYAPAGMPNMRLAQSKLVRMVLNKGEALA
jgi:integrase